MNKRTLTIVFSLLTLLLASMSLTRCGSGIGRLTDANANGIKF